MSKFNKEKMKNINKIAVLGGSGRTGKYLVNHLLNQGFSVRVLVRNPEKFTLQNPKIEIVAGDAVDEKAIHLLLKDCKVIISTIGQRPGEPMVASIATKHVLKTMNDYGIERYVLLAGINIDTPFDKKSEKTKLATDWMKTNYPEIQEDRQLAYDFLTASNVSWTLVRVPLIEFTNTSSELNVSLEDCLGSSISAQDIASFMVNEITDCNFVKKSPFISSI
jgi:putative NADH-flavin reductase